MEVQWYPGHMTRADRAMQEDVRLVDVVIELLDARAVLSSCNPRIASITSGKQRIRLLNKADLADPDVTEGWIRKFSKDGIAALSIDARNRASCSRVKPLLLEVTKAKRERDAARGIKNRPVRILVCGIPNVGKSTFINAFSGKASTKTGNKPGVTRGKQWISIDRQTELLDTPGILWPKFEDPAVGIHLACIGAIRDEVFDMKELAVELLGMLHQLYPGRIAERYHISEDILSSNPGPKACEEILCGIAMARGCLLPGNAADTDKAARILMDDFRKGVLGRMSLEEA